MKIQSTSKALASLKTSALVVGIDQDLKINGVLKTLDKASNSFFTQQQKAGNLPQKVGEIRTFYQVTGLAASAVIVVAYDNTQKGLGAAVKSTVKHLRSHHIDDAVITLAEEKFKDLDLTKVARLIAQNSVDADYICDDYKSEKTKRSKLALDIWFAKDSKAGDKGLTEGIAIGNGMNTLKDLGNAPGNVCTPTYLAKTAKKLATKFETLSVSILKERDIKDLKMGALLSVSKGSIEKPRLIKLQHQGSKDDPIIFVGKGVTFDTGGISLKPGASMDEMKYDMCGGGSVLALMQAVAEMNLPINVIGIVPAVENMPSDRASKPGDVVTSMSGKTVEILNTDAEGRLILCDALTYAQQFKPKALIDIATLTGAVIIGLGTHPTGLMSNNDELAAALNDAGEASGDRVWRLPIWEEYLEQLKSPFADISNLGGREGGSITAGCFLGEFTKDANWAHLDIAGTAWNSGKNKGATGRPVPLLVEYLFSQIKK